MDGRLAGFLFFLLCAILAILLIAGLISPLASGWCFAIALLVLGGLSRGFRQGGGSSGS